MNSLNVTEYDKKYLKKAEKYSCRNIDGIALHNV